MLRNNSTWRRRKARFALLLVGVLIGLAVSELALRLILPQRLTSLLGWVEKPGLGGLYVEDEHLGWRMQSGFRGKYWNEATVSINSFGLRDKEYRKRKQNEFRILSVGDSFAFGHGVEYDETYAKRVELKLRKDNRFPQRDIRVICGGVDGYNTIQIERELDRLIPRLDPDLVLVTFTAANDVAENVIFERRLQTRLQFPVGFLGKHSHVVRLALKGSFGPRFFLANRKTKNIEFAIDRLRKVEQKLKQFEVPFLFLVIPARHQVYPSVHKGSAFLSTIGANGYLTRNYDRVVGHFQTANVPHVDLLPVLSSSNESTYFAHDTHTNALGHDLIADAIVKQLERHLENGL